MTNPAQTRKRAASQTGQAGSKARVAVAKRPNSSQRSGELGGELQANAGDQAEPTPLPSQELHTFQNQTETAGSQSPPQMVGLPSRVPPQSLELISVLQEALAGLKANQKKFEETVTNKVSDLDTSIREQLHEYKKLAAQAGQQALTCRPSPTCSSTNSR